MIKLRLAIQDDCEDIFLWRNDLMTRRMSINSNIISKKEHNDWFNSILKSNNVYLLIILGVDDSKIGIIRYEVKNNKANVSINLNPIYRNKNLAKTCLTKSINEFKKFSSNANILIAKIKENNFPSKKTFEGIGFKFSHKNNNVCVYKLILD